MSDNEKEVVWRNARDHREPKWPLLGYAPGEYVGKCKTCGDRVVGLDKYAWQCFPCAVEDVARILQQAKEEARVCQEQNEALRKAIQIVGGVDV